MSYIYDLDNEYGGRIIADDATTTALTLGRKVISNATTPVLKFPNMSGASIALIDFGNNFVSVASIGTGVVGYLGCAQKWIIVRAGDINYGMPLFGLSTAVNGPGAYV